MLLGVAGWLVVAWGAFVVVDLLGVGGIAEQLHRPLWTHLFNDRPVEWTQWVVLALAVLAAGYLAGRLTATARHDAPRFFLLLGLGLGFMLIEDAGDVRHVISSYVQDHLGAEVLGLPYRVVSDVPYFAALAAIPLYAVIRYGRAAWEAPTVRPYLASAVVLYGLAGGASGVRHLGDLYIRIGGLIDAAVFRGRFPIPPGQTAERTHFLLVDSLLEETVELLAASCMLASVLAYIADLREARLDVTAVR